MRPMRDVIWRLVNDSSWTRTLMIQTSCAEEVGGAIQRIFGRKAELVARRDNGYGFSVSTLRLVISRLEETEMTDIIIQIDDEAVIDVVPGYDREERKARWKRHSRSDLPDVSKYGNELSD